MERTDVKDFMQTRRLRRAREQSLITQRELQKTRLENFDSGLPANLGFVDDPYSEVEKTAWRGRMDQGEARKMLRWMNNPTQYLILRGTVGLGKTVLAVSLARAQVRNRGRSARIVSMPEMLHSISFHERGEDPVKDYASPDILVIDDVGVVSSGMTDHQHKIVWAIINARHNSGKMTIITTNMSSTSTYEGAGLAEMFGESAWDRISSGATVVVMRGESMRQENRRREYGV